VVLQNVDGFVAILGLNNLESSIQKTVCHHHAEACLVFHEEEAFLAQDDLHFE
jgi:hypothetical protein